MACAPADFLRRMAPTQRPDTRREFLKAADLLDRITLGDIANSDQVIGLLPTTEEEREQWTDTIARQLAEQERERRTNWPPPVNEPSGAPNWLLPFLPSSQR
jgi:hypothetical protein